MPKNPTTGKKNTTLLKGTKAAGTSTVTTLRAVRKKGEIFGFGRRGQGANFADKTMGECIKSRMRKKRER